MLKTKLEETKENNHSFFYRPKKTERDDPFIELEETINTYLSPNPYCYRQPSEQFMQAIVDYHIELKTKHDDYTQKINNTDSSPIVNDKRNKEKEKQIKKERRSE
jgi:hypothetical protein